MLYSRRRGRPSFENCSIVSTILQAWTRCPLLTALSIWGHRTDTEFAPDSVTRLGKLKKADIASEAERLADGTGWMPAIFKTEGPQEVTPEDMPEDGAEEAAAVADEFAEALAA